MRLALANGTLVGQLLDFSVSDDLPTTFTGGTSSPIQPGFMASAVSTDGGIDTTSNTPNWGAAEILYVVNTSSSTFNPGRLVHIDSNFALLDMPNTANTGRPVYVTLTRFTAGNTTRQGGWVLRAGMCPVSYSVAATAGAVYFAAAGQATPTLTAGKQILNATCLIAASGSFTRTVTTQNGSPRVRLARVNGLYLGQAISGTGIPASSVISSIDQSGTELVIGSAVGTPVNATATGTVTATFTHTGFGICQIDRPFVQGNIT